MTKKRGAGRQRSVSVQVYLSSSEAAAMRTIAKCDNLTLSQLVRQWIVRAQGERQLELQNVQALNSLAAFTKAARAHGLLPSSGA